MANLRRSLSSRPEVSPVAAPRPRAQRRWPLFALAAVAVLLTLAWIDGGEQPLRPIAQAVDLPEPQP